MEHTCIRSYRNPRCTASYIGKKLVKMVRRQPDIKLKDIQEAVHEKYVVNISAGKASRAREKAQDAVDGAYTAQFNQLWEYCDDLRRCNPGSTVLKKVILILMVIWQLSMDWQLGCHILKESTSAWKVARRASWQGAGQSLV